MPSPRPVTPLVPASTGGVQFYADADHYDRERADALTGDIYSPEWPDVPVQGLNRRGARSLAARPAGRQATAPDETSAPPRDSLSSRGAGAEENLRGARRDPGAA